MRRVFSLLLILILLGICLKACIRADIPEDSSSVKISPKDEKITYPQKNKNIVLNGSDLLQSQAPVQKFGGEIVLSTIGEGPKTFNPCNTKDATSSSMTGLMYDGLVTTNSYTGEIEPLLAKSYEIEGNNYVIHLRKGVRWTDGKPITADDVMYTYEEVIFKGLGNTSTMDAMKIDGKLPEIKKIDDYTVMFTTQEPFAPFLGQLTYPIVPKHYFKPYSDKGSSVFDAFLSPNTPPKEIVSSGPFKLKEYVAAQRVVFVKNNDYYKVNLENKRLPYLDKVVYLIVGDTNNEILKFEAKEIDVLSIKGSNVAMYKEAEPSKAYKVYNLGPDTGTMFLAINLNNRKDKNGKYYVNPIKQKWFGSRDFRAAIDWAIDRKSMVQNVAYGVAEPLFTAESLNSIYLNKYIKGHPYDIEVAKKTLQKAGFVEKNGILYDGEGHRVEFDLYTNAGNLEREAIGVMVKEDLAKLGIKVNFKPVEFNSLVNKMVSSYDWDMIIMGLTGSPLEPHNGINVWNSFGSLHLFNMRPQGYNVDDRLDWEKELDDIFTQGALKMDFEERKSLYDKYQTIIYNERPIIYLYSPTRIVAIRKKFKNVFPSPLSGLLHNLEEIGGAD